MQSQKHHPRAMLATLLAAIVLFVTNMGGESFAVEKILDKTLLPHDPIAAGVYRWSEGSVLSLDGKKHLMMLVTAFGHGGHDHTAADIVRLDSLDGGLTWTPQKDISVFQANIGKANVMSPSLLRLDNGELLCFFMVKNKSLIDSGTWMRRSTDNGKTWSKPERLPYEGYGGLSSDRACQTSSGRIVLPSWVSTDGLKSTWVYCHYSDDRGKTWKKTERMSVPGATGRRTNPAAEEPTVIELKDGRLMMFMRAYVKSIHVSYSDDDGATWSKPTSSGIPSPGAMPTLCRLPNGDILLVWNWAEVEKINGPWPRNRLGAAISTDDGKNFTSLRHLDGSEDFPGKITMANVAVCGENVVVTYSKSMTRKNAYSWRLQVIPLAWFYEGDKSVVYGQKYLPTLEAKLATLKNRPEGHAPKTIPRPKPEQRKAALAAMADRVAECKKENGLVAAFSFEEADGDFAHDLSDHGNDLALLRVGKAPARVDGKEGKALRFDGKGGYLIAPDSKSFDFDKGVFTARAWVFPTANKKLNCILSKEHVFQVALNEGLLQAAVFAKEDRWGRGWVGNTPIPLNRWSHVEVSHDGRQLVFAVDGKVVETQRRRGTLASNNEPFCVGNITHIRDGGFAGIIDEIRILNTVKQENAARLPSQKPRKVGRVHQLFLDKTLIAATSGVQRVLNQPRKHHDNPVLTYDKPWEGNCVITWGSVLYDHEEKRFKIWYEVYKKFPPKGEQGTFLCYATSRDGFHWEKPELGLIDFRGSKANNIVLAERIDSPTVFRDPRPTKDIKYRLFWFGHEGKNRGVCSATSPDGIHWKRVPGIRVNAGDRNTAGWDPSREKYYVITRIPGRGMRTCGLWESDDAVTFKYVTEIAAPDKQDPPKTQFYGIITFPYAGMHLGFLEPFFIPLRKLNTQMMYSHDGLEWTRACERQTFLPWGPPGSWDQAWVIPSHNPPIRVDDQLYIFYQGRQTLHWAEKPFGHIGSVGLSFLRVDGFASVETQWNEGTVTTAPLLLEGKTLHVNAKARPGTVRVEVLDMEGKPIEGFSYNDCRPMSMTDSVDHAVSWKSDVSLEKLADAPVRLRFHIQGAKLYSFWAESE